MCYTNTYMCIPVLVQKTPETENNQYKDVMLAIPESFYYSECQTSNKQRRKE